MGPCVGPDAASPGDSQDAATHVETGVAAEAGAQVGIYEEGPVAVHVEIGVPAEAGAQVEIDEEGPAPVHVEIGVAAEAGALVEIDEDGSALVHVPRLAFLLCPLEAPDSPPGAHRG